MEGEKTFLEKCKDKVKYFWGSFFFFCLVISLQDVDWIVALLNFFFFDLPGVLKKDSGACFHHNLEYRVVVL